MLGLEKLFFPDSSSITFVVQFMVSSSFCFLLERFVWIATLSLRIYDYANEYLFIVSQMILINYFLLISRDTGRTSNHDH
jgi:hypothetical protein